MQKLFFTDCTITNLSRTNHRSDSFHATVNGHKAQKLVMNNAIYHHLINPKENNIKRLWLYRPYFRKSLIIAAVGSASGAKKAIHNNSLTSFHVLAFRLILLSSLVWFLAWILLIVPVFFVYDANISKGWALLEMLTTGAGATAGLLFLVYSRWLHVRISQLESWQPELITAAPRAEH